MDFFVCLWFTFRLRIFPLYGDVTITGEGLQNLSPYNLIEGIEF